MSDARYIVLTKTCSLSAYNSNILKGARSTCVPMTEDGPSSKWEYWPLLNSLQLWECSVIHREREYLHRQPVRKISSGNKLDMINLQISPY